MQITHQVCCFNWNLWQPINTLQLLFNVNGIDYMMHLEGVLHILNML